MVCAASRPKCLPRHARRERRVWVHLIARQCEILWFLRYLLTCTLNGSTNENVIYKVVIGKRAGKDLEKVQRYVADLFFAWVLDVERRGLEEVRKVPGFHDEPCKGNLRRLRSIRLTRGYRAHYRVEVNRVEFVFVEGVNKHEY